jgi:hypothetical protein
LDGELVFSLGVDRAGAVELLMVFGGCFGLERLADALAFRVVVIDVEPFASLIHCDYLGHKPLEFPRVTDNSHCLNNVVMGKTRYSEVILRVE